MTTFSKAYLCVYTFHQTALESKFLKILFNPSYSGQMINSFVRKRDGVAQGVFACRLFGNGWRTTDDAWWKREVETVHNRGSDKKARGHCYLRTRLPRIEDSDLCAFNMNKRGSKKEKIRLPIWSTTKLLNLKDGFSNDKITVEWKLIEHSLISKLVSCRVWESWD